MFKGTVRKEDRSLMNVPFVTGDKALDAKFVKAAEEAGFVNLKDTAALVECCKYLQCDASGRCRKISRIYEKI